MINLELPDLPYSKDALAPYMSAETLELHHDKHHMAYVTNGNKFIKENNFNEDSIEDIVKNSFNKNAPVFNNVSQHLNHMHFWEIMKNNPNGKIPSELEHKINEDFGSVESMKEAFIKDCFILSVDPKSLFILFSNSDGIFPFGLFFIISQKCM